MTWLGGGNWRRGATVAGVIAVALAVPGAATGHDLDHPAPAFAPTAPDTGFQSGGPGAEWEFVASIPTGNPHTDIDFFTMGEDTFASVGTLGIGGNQGGQTIVQLTEDGEVSPRFATGHPSATCLSNPADALGLQHDVEATPKGDAILNAPNDEAEREDTQLLIDATDAPGRCHDQGPGAVVGAPPGGLEIVDVTGHEPKEIGLTSHIGEAHTVNVDPKRPHIAYVVTSDAVGVSEDENGEPQRENEDPDDSDEFDLDGFEVVDMSSCMNFEPFTTLAEKREACRPEVYRYRYPSVDFALGHLVKRGANAIYGCHELEVYEDDTLTCGSGNAAIVFDMEEAFDDKGNSDPTDDEPNGERLDCEVRESSSAAPPLKTEADVTDCVKGEDLTIPQWLEDGAPSLEGVEHVGSAFHQGRGGTSEENPITANDSTEDIDFDHELELTGSGDFVMATDERGGGVSPPGASCAGNPGSPGDLKVGNGGIHAYQVDELQEESPGGAEEPPEDDPGTPEEEDEDAIDERAEQAYRAYARDGGGDKAIYRANVRTGAEASDCTAHVFQQIPGQNRIFMGWYSQGTQVVDFEENSDGTFEFEEAGYFIPTNANTWVSHVFKVEENDDGTFTYWGATGDFALSDNGRNAIDVYKVTLPAPPDAGGPDPDDGDLGGGSGGDDDDDGGGNGRDDDDDDSGLNGALDAVDGLLAGQSCLVGNLNTNLAGLGPIAIGQTRAAVRLAAGAPTLETRRAMRFCVQGGGQTVVTFSAAGLVQSVTTNAPRHQAGSVATGHTLADLRTALGRLRAGPAGTLIGLRARPLVFGTAGGKVSSVSVVSRRLGRSPRALAAALRLADL